MIEFIRKSLFDSTFYRLPEALYKKKEKQELDIMIISHFKKFTDILFMSVQGFCGHILSGFGLYGV